MLRVISFVDMLSPTTPAGPRSLIARAFRLSGFRRVLRGGSLPRSSVGSAPASLISRPARRSLALRPIHSLNRLTALLLGMLLRRSFRFVAPLATGWSDPVAGWVPIPTENDSLSTPHTTAKSRVPGGQTFLSGCVGLKEPDKNACPPGLSRLCSPPVVEPSAAKPCLNATVCWLRRFCVGMM